MEIEKKELGTLYVLCRMIENGTIAYGTADGIASTHEPVTVRVLQREESEDTRRYVIEGEQVRLIPGRQSRNGQFEAIGESWLLPRTLFSQAAAELWQLLQTASSTPLQTTPAIDNLLQQARIYETSLRGEDRSDLCICPSPTSAQADGYTVLCRPSGLRPLLDGGRTANLKLEQTGIRLPGPTINKINALPAGQNEVAERMRMIIRMGGVLKYNDVADKVFRANLQMIDLHFPRMLAEMVRIMHMEDLSRITDLTERIKALNPLKIKDELIQKHGYYEYKVKLFLLALAQGMRPAKIFHGLDDTLAGMLHVSADGNVLCYNPSQRLMMADFLFRHTRLEKTDPIKDRYGILERENGAMYFKLNARIGFTKR